jgi:hypothetical protein
MLRLIKPLLTGYILDITDDMEGFLRSLMDENAFRDDLMDEENYQYDGEGMFTNISTCPLCHELNAHPVVTPNACRF